MNVRLMTLLGYKKILVRQQEIVADSMGLFEVTGSSADDFEVKLAAIMSKLSGAQNALKIQEVKVAREARARNERKPEKIKESEVAAKKAQKSGLASKIFGWIRLLSSLLSLAQSWWQRAWGRRLAH
ncbi:type III secretion system translocon subunit SctE [Photobacterium leiognathi]|uniref:type III secretion system translocon subunit SctE n=1 Tax=Photobacterium leiognathi TaxID=553611 RepID=UPI003F74D40E